MKKALTAVMALALLLSLAVPAFAAAFTDIEGHWAEEDIEQVAALGYFNGYDDGSFAPDDTMTRAMFVTALGRMAETAGIDITAEASSFTDTDSTAYYTKYLDWAYANGIVFGTGENTFSPNGTVTREQICTMLVRFLTSCTANDLTGYAAYSIAFDDADTISSWAREAVAICCGAGIVNGKDGNIFDPLSGAKRAEVAKILVRTASIFGIDLGLGEAGPIDTGIPVPDPIPAPTPSGSGSETDDGSESGYTEEEIAAEAEIYDLLTDMYANFNKHYASGTGASANVDSFMGTLMQCVGDALEKRDSGSFLSKDFIRSEYAAEISELKELYHGFTDDQIDELSSIAIRLGTYGDFKQVFDYFGINMPQI